MKRKKGKHRILILGASGFLGSTIYRELLSYFKVYGTYCKQHGLFLENKVFTRFCAEEDSISMILNEIKPTLIISAFTGNLKNNFEAHKEIVTYLNLNSETKILFLSSATVFDGNLRLPAYENDKTVSVTESGRHKISIEKLLLENIPKQTTILRIPIVLGYNSPIINHLRQTIKYSATFDVYPNLVVSVTTATKLAQQIHYIINKEFIGIYHLASNDMIHYDELFKEITEKISDKNPIFKNIYDSNNDTYSALLPKLNKLPATHDISIAEVITESTFNDEIVSLKMK